MEVIAVVICIILVALLSPWILKIIGYFQEFIPGWILNFLFLAIALKLILFIFHRGSEG